MKISIITICYNRVSTIESAIQSVLSQNYQAIEYIVVDGGSTDGTQAVIEKYRSEISHYISEPDKGMYDALNKAIKMATGELVMILHSDDEFYNEKVVQLYADEYLKSGADVLYANGVYIKSQEPRTKNKESRTRNQDNRQQTTDSRQQTNDDKTQNSKLETPNEKIKRIYNAKPFKKWYLYFGWIPLHTTIAVKKDVFDRFGLYKDHYRIASDYEISLRWFSNASLKKHFINACVVKMKLGGKSTSASLQKKKSTEDLDIIKQYKLWGIITLAFKIARKIPQYLLPRITHHPN